MHLALSSYTKTHIYTCMFAQRRKGKKDVPSEDLFIKCAVKSCQPFDVRANFQAPGDSKERIQTRAGYNII